MRVSRRAVVAVHQPGVRCAALLFRGIVHLSLRHQLGFFAQQPQARREGDGARPRHYARDLFYGYDHRVRRAASACKLYAALRPDAKALGSAARLGAAGPLSRAHLPHRALRGRRDHADAAPVALRLHHARLRLGGLFPAAAVVLRVPARHLGRALCQAGRLPQWFYTARAPRLALVGRHALLLYVLHQPLLYALTMLLRLIFIR